MLGYRGRSNRRDFIGGWALLVVGPMPVGQLWELMAGWLGSSVENDSALATIVLLAAGLLSLGLLLVWLWGATVLLTRRARDLGWPAWSGVAAAVIAGAAAYFFGVAIFFSLLGVMAAIPGRRERSEAEMRARVFG